MTGTKKNTKKMVISSQIRTQWSTVRASDWRTAQNTGDRETKMTVKLKRNIANTESTREHIQRKNIETGKNTDINREIKMTAIVTKNGSRIQIPIGIIVLNTNIQIRLISGSPRIVICDSINENMILGESSFLHTTVYVLLFLYILFIIL